METIGRVKHASINPPKVAHCPCLQLALRTLNPQHRLRVQGECLGLRVQVRGFRVQGFVFNS